MSERFERLVTYGPAPVTYGRPETWTADVRRLFAKLKRGESEALAPLLAQDLEFIRDPDAFSALVRLKYDPGCPAEVAHRELRKIANVIRRRPARRRANLPYADRLRVELEWLTGWIQRYSLLESKRDRAVLRKRIQAALHADEPKRHPNPAIAYVEGDVIDQELEALPKGGRAERLDRLAQEEEDLRLSRAQELWRAGEPMRNRLTEALMDGVQPGQGLVRTARSWAINTLAVAYGVDTKRIDRLLARDTQKPRRRQRLD